MRKIERLKREARELAYRKGHELGKFTTKVCPIPGTVIGWTCHAYCYYCKTLVIVNDRPELDGFRREIEIGESKKCQPHRLHKRRVS